jgi:hypothetical protein
MKEWISREALEAWEASEVNFVNVFELCYLSIVVWTLSIVFELCPSCLNFVHRGWTLSIVVELCYLLSHLCLIILCLFDLVECMHIYVGLLFALVERALLCSAWWSAACALHFPAPFWSFRRRARRLRALHADTARWFGILQRADIALLLEMLLGQTHTQSRHCWSLIYYIISSLCTTKIPSQIRHPLTLGEAQSLSTSKLNWCIIRCISVTTCQGPLCMPHDSASCHSACRAGPPLPFPPLRERLHVPQLSF